MPVNSTYPNEKPVLFYEKKGKGKNIIVFIHGFGLNRKSWYDISDLLIKKAEIYLVDLIGSGDSPAPENFPYTIESQANILLNFILKNRFSGITLAGHSYGGGVCLMLLHQLKAMKHNHIVKQLILIAPAVYPQPLPFFMMIPSIPFLGPLLMKQFNAEFQIRLTLKTVFYDSRAVTCERSNRYKNNITRHSYRYALIQTAKNVMPEKTDRLLAEIKTITPRTLLIYGEKESVISMENLEKLSKILPDGKTKIIKRCGHVPHEEHPGPTADLISEFLLSCCHQ